MKPISEHIILQNDLAKISRDHNKKVKEKRFEVKKEIGIAEEKRRLHDFFANDEIAITKIDTAKEVKKHHIQLEGKREIVLISFELLKL